MSSRVTQSDVYALLEDLEPMLHERDLMPADAHLTLDIGSPTYGRAWRLHYTFTRDSGREGWSANYALTVTDSMGWIGNSAREAWETIATIKRVLWAVGDAAKRPVDA